jgi:hypothetical protein
MLQRLEEAGSAVSDRHRVRLLSRMRHPWVLLHGALSWRPMTVLYLLLACGPLLGNPCVPAPALAVKKPWRGEHRISAATRPTPRGAIK